MARIRSIKPEFWSDLALARLSRDARLLYISLWNQADEHSRMHGDPRWIKGHCLPYDDDLNLARINELLEELETMRRIIRYIVDGAPYLFLPKLADHQRLEPNKASSRLPAPPDTPGEAEPPDASPGVSAQVVADPGEARPIVVQQVAGSREHVAGVTPMAHGETVPNGKTVNQRANDLADAYAKHVPLSNHQAAAGIFRKALNAAYPDAQVWLALARLVDANRGLTAESLRRELEGPPAAMSRNGQILDEAMARAQAVERGISA